tara:strand:- start:10 stop:738 length:729 start_codon:yes stop_codon:yes gene_type:complete
MRQIGVNQFVGDHPAIIESLQEIHIEIDKHKQHEQDKFNKLTPVGKFFNLLNKIIKRPLKFGQNNNECELYQYKEYTFMELEPVKELTGVPSCSEFMVDLNIIYTIDSQRSNGFGRQAMDILTKTCEKSGAVLVLFCNPFGIGKYGQPYAIVEPKEFVQNWYDDDYETVYLPKYEADITKFFYRQRGMVNLCLYDDWVYDRDKEDDLPVDRQFAYLPENLEGKYKDQLEDRLNIELCKYCNR